MKKREREKKNKMTGKAFFSPRGTTTTTPLSPSHTHTQQYNTHKIPRSSNSAMAFFCLFKRQLLKK